MRLFKSRLRWTVSVQSTSHTDYNMIWKKTIACSERGTQKNCSAMILSINYICERKKQKFFFQIDNISITSLDKHGLCMIIASAPSGFHSVWMAPHNRSACTFRLLFAMVVFYRWSLKSSWNPRSANDKLSPEFRPLSSCCSPSLGSVFHPDKRRWAVRCLRQERTVMWRHHPQQQNIPRQHRRVRRLSVHPLHSKRVHSFQLILSRPNAYTTNAADKRWAVFTNDFRRFVEEQLLLRLTQFARLTCMHYAMRVSWIISAKTMKFSSSTVRETCTQIVLNSRRRPLSR